MRRLSYTVTESDAGRAVRTVVPRRFSLGAHAFRRLKVLEAIQIGGQPVRADYRVKPGEVIDIFLPDDEAGDASPEKRPLFGPPSIIRYQDEDLLVIAKGAPLATLPGAHIKTGTLREQLAAMLGAPEETFVYHPVNRLDKGTSGLLVVARHAHSQHPTAVFLAYVGAVIQHPGDGADADTAALGDILNGHKSYRLSEKNVCGNVLGAFLQC